MNKKLGIITGAGAFSGFSLYGKILQAIGNMGVKHDKDFPQIILHNYPFDSMDEKGINDMAVANIELSYALKPLLGCEKILIACNTLHLICEDSRLIHLPNLAQKELKSDVGKSLILCSESSRKNKLFGENSCYLSDHLLNLSNLIIAQKIKGVSVDELSYVNEVFDEAERYGVSCIVIGCTELSMINWKYYENNFLILDTVDLAIKEILKWHFSGE